MAVRTSVRGQRTQFLPGAPHATRISARSVSQALGASPTFDTLRGLVRSLVQFRKKKSSLQQLDHLRQLVLLLQEHPEISVDAWKVGIVPTLVELKACGQAEVERQARLALSLLGYVPPYSGRGIRILSVDGGGTRFAGSGFYKPFSSITNYDVIGIQINSPIVS